MWWRGSRWWFSFYILIGAFRCACPFFPWFRSTPSNSRVPSAVLGTTPFSCFTSFTLLLNYLQEWTEVIGTSLVCAQRRLVWCFARVGIGVFLLYARSFQLFLPFGFLVRHSLS